MKENNVPEKIYLTSDEKNSYVFTQKRSDGMGVEYILTDAFIEKACAFIRERLIFDDNAWYIEGEVTVKDQVIEDFKDYMKGE